MSIVLLNRRRTPLDAVDMPIPVEWQGATSVTLAAPYEHLLISDVAVDLPMPGEHLAPNVVDLPSPAEHLERTQVDLPIPAEWEGTTVVQLSIPYEHLGLVAIATESVTHAIIAAVYSATLVAVGGAPPYTWAVDSGSLPEGLSLNASTGEISGTPTALGRFEFTIEVTDDGGGTDTHAYVIVVSALPIEGEPTSGDPLDGVVNDIEIEVVTRVLGDMEEAVWRLVTPIEIPASGTVTVHARDRGSPAAWLMSAVAPTADDIFAHGDWADPGSDPSTTVINDIIYAEGLFVAVGSGIFTSPDLGTWTQRVAPGTFFQRVRYGNGMFMAFGTSELYRSANGTSWTSIVNNLSGTNITGLIGGLAEGAGRWVLVGTTSGGGVAIVYSDNDGTSWSNASIDGSTNMVFLRGVVYTGDPRFSWIVAGAGTEVFVSGNGSSYVSVSAPTGFPRTNSGGVLDIAYDADRHRVIAVLGYQGQVYMGAPDPMTWERQQLPVDGNWSHVKVRDGAAWIISRFDDDSADREFQLVANRSLNPGDWQVVSVGDFDGETEATAFEIGGGYAGVITLTGDVRRLPLVTLDSVTLGRTSGATVPITLEGTAGTVISQLQLRAKRLVVAEQTSVRNTVTPTYEEGEDPGTQHFQGSISPDLGYAAAQELADLYVEQFGHGLPSLTWGTIGKDEASLDAVIDREIGDRVRVTVPRRGIDAEYIVVATDEDVTDAALVHRARYVGIPAPEVE